MTWYLNVAIIVFKVDLIVMSPSIGIVNIGPAVQKRRKIWQKESGFRVVNPTFYKPNDADLHCFSFYDVSNLAKSSRRK